MIGNLNKSPSVGAFYLPQQGEVTTSSFSLGDNPGTVSDSSGLVFK